MVGLKVRGWIPLAVAGGSLGVGGCVGRTYDFGFDTEGFAGSGDSGTTGDPTGNPTDPTSNPTDPTSNPTDPTVDPTDPTSDPGAPPQLLNVVFLDNLTLQLTFSEPMASVDAIDPTLFRLSMAFGIPDDYYADGARTFYQDVGYYAQDPYCEDYNCYEVCDPYYYGTSGYYGSSGYYGDTGKYCYEYCYDYCPPSPVNAFNLRNDLYDPTKVLLQLDRGITGQVCDLPQQLPPEIVAGLFLHYTDDRPPIPVDTQGQGLFPIGEQWALTNDTFLEVPGMFPNLGGMQPIPCPF